MNDPAWAQAYAAWTIGLLQTLLISWGLWQMRTASIERNRQLDQVDRRLDQVDQRLEQQAAEQRRVQAEQSRVQAEYSRAQAEQSRVQAEHSQTLAKIGAALDRQTQALAELLKRTTG